MANLLFDCVVLKLAIAQTLSQISSDTQARLDNAKALLNLFDATELPHWYRSRLGIVNQHVRALIAHKPRCFLNVWKIGFAKIIRFARSMSLSTNLILRNSGSVGSIPRQPDGLHTIHLYC